MIKALVQKALGYSGRMIINTRRHYDADGLFTVHSDHFRYDPVFRAAYQRGIEANNGVDPHFEWRLHVALWAASCALGAAGGSSSAGAIPGL